jgi:hypothetical protein
MGGKFKPSMVKPSMSFGSAPEWSSFIGDVLLSIVVYTIQIPYEQF